MADYTPLSRPVQSQVSLNPTPQQPASDGFNFPVCRLVNKNFRAKLSDSWPRESSTTLNYFTVANHKGWFVALRITDSRFELISSPLDELRTAIIDSTAEDPPLFSPKRLVSLPAKPNLITFAESDSRLIVAFEQGSLAVYDGAVLCSPGSGDVQPLYNNQVQNSPFRQILPNPGSEPGLSDLLAVVGDGKVHLWNTRLESQGGWAATDLMSQPIDAAWSPKGKHIAIGLQTGDILTFALNNKSTPNKHIPPTANDILTSLSWLGPGHTFRTCYSPSSGTGGSQYIINLDTKTNTATYYDCGMIYGLENAPQYGCHVAFPKWDEDASSPGTEINAVICGDLSSYEFDIMGNIGNKWYKQTLENPLALPLDKDSMDNSMAAFAYDLTDMATGLPIIYSYMNDGTIVGWYVEGTKPYVGMGGGSATSATTNTAAKDSDMGAEQTTGAPVSAFAAPPTSVFGTSSFGQSSSPASTTTGSAFGQSSFGQTSGFGAFGGSSPSAFGTPASPPKPASSTAGGFGAFSGGGFSGFGAAANNNNTGGFGGNGSAFGATGNTTNGFGSNNNTASTFGSTGFGSNTSTSTFGSTGFGSANNNTSNNAFGSQTNAFGGTPSAFGSTPSSTGAFGAFGSSSGTSNVFGQPVFGAPSEAAPQTPSSSLAPPSSMMREASMSDDSGSVPSGGFGGLGLGSSTPNSSNATNSMFGAFGAPSTSSNPAESSGSAFGSASGGGFLKPATAFGSAGALGQNSPFSLNKPAATTTSAFAPVNSSTTTTPTTSGFGQSGFGATSAFGKTSFGQPSTLGASPAQPAFGSTGFGAKAGGFGAFGGGNTTFTSAAASPAPVSGGFAAFTNAGTSGFTKAAETVAAKTEEGGAPAKPVGFAGFGSSTPSGFGTFGAKKEEEKKEDVQTEETKKPFTSVFGTPSVSSDGSEKESVFKKPTERFAPSPPDSPTPTPATIPSSSPFGKPITSPPAGLASPTASPTPAAAIPPATHAFSNLKASPSPFKLPTGFGAFGSTTPTSSPFTGSKVEETPTKVSAFGGGAFGSAVNPPPKPSGFGAPTFGSTSTLGSTKIVSKSAFGTSVVHSAFPPITPSPGAGGDTAPATPETPSKASTAKGFSAFSGGVSAFGQVQKDQKTSFSDLLKTGGDAAKEKEKEDAKEHEEEEDDTVKVKVQEETKTDTEDEEDEKKGKPLGSTTDDRSYASVLASSVGSSFVEVSRTDGGSDDGDGEDRSYSDEDEPPEEEYEEEEDYTDEEEDEEYEDDGHYDEEEDNEGGLPKTRSTPTAVPLPSSRSSSTTPGPEIPSVEVSPSPRERSTTPPGTPSRDKSPLGGSTTPGGIGLGRPSTRPVRSSPLATNILSAEEHKDDEGSPSASKRPRTPPLLSSFNNISAPTPVTAGAAKPSILKPMASFGSSDTSGKAAPAWTPTAGLFGASTLPTATKSEPSKSPSMFGSAFGAAAAGSKSTPAFGGIGLGAAPTTGADAKSGAAGTSSPFSNMAPFSLKPGSTPPSLFGAPVSNAPTPPAPSASAPPIAAKAPAGSLFGSPPPPIPNFGKPTPPPPMFGKAPPAPMMPLGQPPLGAGLFGKLAAPVASGGTVPTPSGFVGFGQAPQAPKVSAPPTAAPVPLKSLMSTPPPPPLVRVQGEELQGMQRECADLVESIERDLQDLRNLGEITLQKCAVLKVAKPPQTKADLSSPEKWNFGSLTQFGDVLKEFQDDLEYMEGQRTKLKASLKDLQNNLLKAGTRKEEIARFNKAQNDPEFAKMLKARTLGPEHSEMQTQLRKSIRILRDRIHKLESHIQDSKKKLAASISGKPTFKAPTLDTINRTYRNIDSLILQEAADVNRLAARVSKIDVNDLPSTPQKSAGSSSDSRKGYQVAPNVAITTAAALNAERSAHKLKKALLAVRKEPLLNKKVEVAPTAPTAFNSPQKPLPANGAFAFQVPVKGSLFGDPAPTPDEFPEFTLPTDEDSFSPGTLSTSSGRRGGGQRKHPSVPLKRTAAPAVPVAAPVAAPSFDWGPLPAFNAPKPAASGFFVPFSSSSTLKK